MKAVAIVGMTISILTASVVAQDPLRDAKDLYASAAYEDALLTLTKLSSAGAPPDVQRQTQEYRAFCLFALGRNNEAESVAETIIKKDPFARLDAADASPRLEAMFAGVRKRLLPSLIRERFRSARADLDKKDYSAAEPQLTQAHLMIADAEKLGVRDDALADLGVLVDGFLQMIHLTSEQRKPAVVAAASEVAAPAPTVKLPPAPPQSYSAADEGITAPVALEQRMPTMNAVMARIAQSTHRSGILDIVISEKGEVVDAVVRQSLMPAYDTLVAASARRWKYRPAMKDGAPVRYVKSIALVVP
jgi:hypothetical protein